MTGFGPISVSRRDMLRRTSLGFGSLALAAMLDDVGRASLREGDPLAAKLPHFAPRAKRMIFLFMHGGPSHMDLFDYKPELNDRDDQPLPFAKPRVQFAPTSTLLASRWKFQQHGQSGAWVSELLPNIAQVVDDLCFLKSVHGTNAAHGGAIIKLQTGSDQFVRPSMGSWISYGLGTENRSLPSFLTIGPSYQHGGVRNYSSAFLPAAHHGTPIGGSRMKLGEAQIEHLQNAAMAPQRQRDQLELLASWHRQQLQETGPDRELEGRIASFELAFRMQTAAPALFDISNESQATRRLYGLDDEATSEFGYRCLLARRFSESGVRFVQASHGSDYKWDHHAGLREGLTTSTREIDRPVAGLIRDLKDRGLLDETLVLWGGEFGRTPCCQGDRRDGRDHNPAGFTMFMAGGGVKPGITYGATDEFGYYAQDDKLHVHDLHATMLHLLGLDHERLTYRYQGRDFRLTDVEGNVAHPIIV